MFKIAALLVFLYLNQVTSTDYKGLDLIGSGNNCTIINRKWNEFLYPADGFNYDDSRRRVFSWIPATICGNQCNWRIETVSSDSGPRFRLKSLYFAEYFYAAAGDLKHDSQRRNVFTWIPSSGCDDDQCYWEIQLLKDGSKYFTIKNIGFEEYLYGADGLNYDDDRRRVFTWTDSFDVANDQASHWAINCK